MEYLAHETGWRPDDPEAMRLPDIIFRYDLFDRSQWYVSKAITHYSNVFRALIRQRWIANMVIGVIRNKKSNETGMPDLLDYLAESPHTLQIFEKIDGTALQNVLINDSFNQRYFFEFLESSPQRRELLLQKYPRLMANVGYDFDLIAVLSIEDDALTSLVNKLPDLGQALLDMAPLSADRSKLVEDLRRKKEFLQYLSERYEQLSGGVDTLINILTIRNQLSSLPVELRDEILRHPPSTQRTPRAANPSQAGGTSAGNHLPTPTLKSWDW
jgi:hypothetical protein